MNVSKRKLIPVPALTAALALAACGSGSSDSGAGTGGPGPGSSAAGTEPVSATTSLPQGSEPVQMNPADFTARISNPYLPLRPGSRWISREVENGRYKVSLRSRGDVDVEQVARRHGGGGHKNAAGFTTEATLPQLRERLVGELAAALPAAVVEAVGDPA